MPILNVFRNMEAEKLKYGQRYGVNVSYRCTVQRYDMSDVGLLKTVVGIEKRFRLIILPETGELSKFQSTV